MTTQSITVVLTGGGSGGHITPLLPLGHALKSADPRCQVVYIGLKGDPIDSFKKDFQLFDGVYYVSSGKFRRYHGQTLAAKLVDIKTLLLNFRDIFKVIAGTIFAYKLLRKIKPDVVFSKGGFVVVPVGLAARLLSIPIITHDSDAASGLANRIIGRWAKIHTTGMPPENYNYPRSTVRYVGIPVMGAVDPNKLASKSYRIKQGIAASDPILLIAGGGLGSRTINNMILIIAPRLLSELPKLRIIHITGDKLLDSVKEQYQQSVGGDDYQRLKLVGFSDQLTELIDAADLVIARAGATTLAELELYAKPSIIIPAPFLAAAHQLKNAQVLKDANAAIVVSEQIESDDLYNLVKDLINDGARRHQLSSAISTFAHPNAAQELAKIIIHQAINKN